MLLDEAMFSILVGHMGFLSLQMVQLVLVLQSLLLSQDQLLRHFIALCQEILQQFLLPLDVFSFLRQTIFQISLLQLQFSGRSSICVKLGGCLLDLSLQILDLTLRYQKFSAQFLRVA